MSNRLSLGRRPLLSLGLNSILLALLVLLAGGPVMAQEEGNRILHITPTEASSNCIGDLSRPLCAAETMIACELAARVEAYCNAPLMKPAPVANGRAEYYFHRILFPSRKLQRKTQRLTDDEVMQLHPGDFVVIYAQRSCPATQASCAGQPWTEVVSIFSFFPQRAIWGMGLSSLADAFQPGWFDE